MRDLGANDQWSGVCSIEISGLIVWSNRREISELKRPILNGYYIILNKTVKTLYKS